MNRYNFLINDVLNEVDLLGLSPISWNSPPATPAPAPSITSSLPRVTSVPASDPPPQTQGQNTKCCGKGKNRKAYDPAEQCCKNDKIEEKVTDDAGRKCCEFDIKTVQLRNARGSSLSDVGHSFVVTPNHAYGFYPSNTWHFFFGRGIFQEDSKHKFDPKLTYSYKACPETVTAVDKAMMKDVSRNKSTYDLINAVGYNCTGMACKWIDAGGLTAPFSSYAVGLMPVWSGDKQYGWGRKPK